MPIIPPTVAEVGTLMRARTRDSMGNELGTFTTDTRPTATEVTEMIDSASELVEGRLGDVPERLEPIVTTIIALRAAMAIELSYFPEEVGDDQSAYARYREQFQDALADYQTSIESDRGVDASKRIGIIRIGTYYQP